MQSHLPGYVTDYDKLKSAGAEIVVCVTVNDAFVANAWGEQHGTKGKVCYLQVCVAAMKVQQEADGSACPQVTVLADPKGDLAKAMGVTLDGEGILAAFGTARGKRCVSCWSLPLAVAPSLTTRVRVADSAL